LVIVQAFVIAAYGWTQTSSMLVFLGLGVFAVMSIAAGFTLISKFGTRFCLVMAITLASFGTAIMSLAGVSHLFLILGGLVLACAAFGNPAYLALVSEMVPPEEQAQLQGGIGAVGLLASAVAMPMYSALFRQFGAGGECNEGKAGGWAWLPFAIACCFMTPAACLLLYWVHRFPHGSFRVSIEGDINQSSANETPQMCGADAGVSQDGMELSELPGS